MLPYLFNGSGTTNYGYRPRHSYGYGNSYASRGLGNSNYFGQMRAISRLMNELNRMSKGSVVSPMQTNRLGNALMGVTSGMARPPAQTVQQLSMALGNALPTRSVPMMNTGQLARDLAVVMNGNGMNMMQIQNSIGNAQAVMHSSGVGMPGIQSVTHGLRMVATWATRASLGSECPETVRSGRPR